MRGDDDPNILALKLDNGRLVEFDGERGWYDTTKRLVEGTLTTNETIRIPVESVDSASVYQPGLLSTVVRWTAGTIFGTFSLIIIGVGIALLIILTQGHR
jgi:hypothetical protein